MRICAECHKKFRTDKYFICRRCRSRARREIRLLLKDPKIMKLLEVARKQAREGKERDLDDVLTEIKREEAKDHFKQAKSEINQSPNPKKQTGK